MKQFFGKNSSDFAKDVYLHVEKQEMSPAVTLGPYNSAGLLNDPRRVGFLFARYKFAAKMLVGSRSVLEIGCQEGLGSMVVAQAVEHLVSTDFYKPHIESCQERLVGLIDNIEFRGHDIIDGPVEGRFDGAFSLDVIEHIDPTQEHSFMANIASSLTEHGVFVLGSPSLESQKYASKNARDGHINCHSGEEFRELCQRYYHNVFMFGMNDEVLHTGFLPMAHYILALCTNPK